MHPKEIAAEEILMIKRSPIPNLLIDKRRCPIPNPRQGTRPNPGAFSPWKKVEGGGNAEWRRDDSCPCDVVFRTRYGSLAETRLASHTQKKNLPKASCGEQQQQQQQREA
jgi:hypothetical protein